MSLNSLTEIEAFVCLFVFCLPDPTLLSVPMQTRNRDSEDGHGQNSSGGEGLFLVLPPLGGSKQSLFA